MDILQQTRNIQDDVKTERVVGVIFVGSRLVMQGELQHPHRVF